LALMSSIANDVDQEKLVRSELEKFIEFIDEFPDSLQDTFRELRKLDFEVQALNSAFEKTAALHASYVLKYPKQDQADSSTSPSCSSTTIIQSTPPTSIPNSSGLSQLTINPGCVSFTDRISELAAPTDSDCAATAAENPLLAQIRALQKEADAHVQQDVGQYRVHEAELLLKQASDQIMSICNRKVEYMQKKYDELDKYIRSLDGTIRRHDVKLRKEWIFDNISAGPVDLRNKRKADRIGAVSIEDTDGLDIRFDSMRYLRRELTKATTEGEEEVDASEPVYCTCQKHSYGEMIACDNQDCRIEWFHFACVELEQKPRGEWYCKECVEAGFSAKSSRKKKKSKRGKHGSKRFK